MKKYIGIIVLNFLIFLSVMFYLDRKLDSYYSNYIHSLTIRYNEQIELQKKLNQDINRYDAHLQELKKEIKKTFKPSDYSGKTVEELANEFRRRGF